MSGVAAGVLIQISDLGILNSCSLCSVERTSGEGLCTIHPIVVEAEVERYSIFSHMQSIGQVL